MSYRSERPGQAIFVISANGKQVTQILLHRFGDESLQQVRDEAKAAAIKLAEMYTAENLEKATLILRRDRLLPPTHCQTTAIIRCSTCPFVGQEKAVRSGAS